MGRAHARLHLYGPGHRLVRRNLLFGAPRKDGGRVKEAIVFDEVVRLLGVERLLDRSPRNLSGGERQRVAIGRALLSQPGRDGSLCKSSSGPKPITRPFSISIAYAQVKAVALAPERGLLGGAGRPIVQGVCG
jgi:hypothetical protein